MEDRRWLVRFVVFLAVSFVCFVWSVLCCVLWLVLFLVGVFIPTLVKTSSFWKTNSQLPKMFLERFKATN